MCRAVAEEQAQADGYRAEKGFFRLSLYYTFLHFAALLAQVKAATVDAYAHQDLPFEQVVDALVTFSRYAVPQPLLMDVVDTMGRFGRLQLVKSPVHGLTLVSFDRAGATHVFARH